MPKKLELEFFLPSERLPALLSKVIVVTKGGEAFFAARFARDKARSKIQWGRVKGKLIIGIVDEVENWAFFHKLSEETVKSKI